MKTLLNLPAPNLAASTVALLLAAASASPAYANIENTAKATGTYGATTVDSATDSESVPVVPKAATLTMDKSAGLITTSLGTDSAIVDGGDTIAYTYVISNTGNVTIYDVTPEDSGPTFGGLAGTGSLSAFTLTAGSATLDPGQSATFTATYTLSTLDVLRAAGTTDGVENTATGKGNDLQNTPVVSAGDTATSTIAAGPKLTIAKAATLNDTAPADGQAAVGETITYTYTIRNTGNVALTNVAVADEHEGTLLASNVYTGEALVSDGPLAPAVASTDAASNGVWDVLQPGAEITITYTHFVTQLEVDNQ